MRPRDLPHMCSRGRAIPAEHFQSQHRQLGHPLQWARRLREFGEVSVALQQFPMIQHHLPHFQCRSWDRAEYHARRPAVRGRTGARLHIDARLLGLRLAVAVRLIDGMPSSIWMMPRFMPCNSSPARPASEQEEIGHERTACSVPLQPFPPGCCIAGCRTAGCFACSGPCRSSVPALARAE